MKITKRSLALEIYRDNHQLPRKDIVRLVMRTLKVTENSAKTHVTQSAKIIDPTIGKFTRTRRCLKPEVKREVARKLILERHKDVTRKEMVQILVRETTIKSEASASIHISKIMGEEGIAFKQS